MAGSVGLGDVTARASASTLLRKHVCDGVNAEDLLAMLADCDDRTLSPGESLCREGEQGDSLFILLAGEVRVLKRDPRGVERELAVLKAPALLGHMSLVDGSARSASCVVAGPARVVTMSRRVYEHRIREIGPPGTALRRLLLSSLTQQLVRGNAQLSELLTDSGSDEATAEEDQETLFRTAGALRGWGIDNELGELLDSVEVVQTEDDRRALMDRKFRR